MNRPLLALKEVVCVRGGRRLFDRVSLALDAGECVEVRGANGSGKSTLLRAVAGLFPNYLGVVEAAPCSYLGHKNAVTALLSPLDNLRIYEGRRAGSAIDALAQVGLGDALRQPCGRLSEGQRRRVALARLLLGGQPLWLLDEPLTALDDAGRALVQRLAAEHCAGGGGVLCATHQALARSARRLRLVLQPSPKA